MTPAEVGAFWRPRAEALRADPVARAGITRFHRSAWGSPPAPNEDIAFDESLETLLEEAELAAGLVFDELGTAAILEVGGGVGLLHGFLRAAGVDAHALEPSAPGFEGSWEIGAAVLRTAGVDTSRWHRLYARDAVRTGTTFGFVFSLNLLEHVDDLGGTLAGLAAVLAADGRMVHHTVNYVIPYEPHFRIPLVPGAPRLTRFFRPDYAATPVWQGLNFVTVAAVAKACRDAGLHAEFEPGMVARALERLETDPLFRSRHGAFLPVWRVLRAVGLARALERLPPGLATPMRFTASHADTAAAAR